MLIKSLKLKGFKSFADETEITFVEGINCIVGPNGCGKSNVVDALKWIVGDTSAKGMRAGSLKDVIFKGSEARRAARSAEVSLTLLNDDLLSISRAEVEVKRKVKSSGDSEFYINNRKVRLKDIQEFFASIGLGNRDYAFFEQGQIDRVLRMKPQERRALIDEAAEVTIFKEKKEETLKELAEAEQNLENVKGILEEVGKNLRTLKQQAEKAKRFKELRKREKELEVKLCGIQLKNIKLTKEFTESNLKVLREDRTSLEREIATLKTDVETLKENLKEITSELETTSKELHELEKSKKESSVKESFLSREIKRLEEEIDEKKFELSSHEKRVRQLEEEVRNLKEKEQELLKELSHLEQEEKKRKEDLEKLRKEKERVESERKKILSEISSISERVNKLRLDIAREDEKRKSIEKQIGELPKKIESINKEVEIARGEYLRLKEKLQQVKQARNSIRREIEDKKKELKEKEQSLHLLESEISTEKEEIASISSRIDATKRALESIDFEKLERKIVESGKKGKVKGYMGLILNFLDVDSGWEKVVESYISQFGAGIVLKTFEDLLWVKERIKGNGRVLLFSAEVEEVKGAYVPEATPLTAHVRARDTRVKNLVNLLFSNVFFVQSGAEKLAKKYPNCVFIDKDYNIFSGRGSVVGKFSQNSVLELEREVEKLEEELEERKKTLIEKESILKTKREEVEELRVELDELKERLQEENIAVFRIESRVKEQEKRSEELKKRREELERKFSEYEEFLASSASRRELIEEELKKLQEKRESLKQLLLQIETSEQNIQKEVEGKREQLQEVTSTKMVSMEKLSSLREKLNAKETAFRRLEKSIVELKKKLLKDEDDLEKARKELEKVKEFLENIDETIEDVKKELIELGNRRNEIEHLISNKEEALKERERTLKEKEREIQKLEVELAKLNVKEEDAIRKILELGSSVGEALQSVADESVPEDEIKKELINLKEKISKIGAVNLLAIEEYEKIKERYGFIIEQEKDLIKSIKNLKEAIKELDEEIEKRFVKTFKSVNRHFRKTFKKVFGGGTARLILTSENISEAGIEIEAKPPGKKHSSINLLSGGERTLVALAFLYALYSVRPAPFVVLDEVDAALDDANTLRFIELLKQMALETQVIVVTHNKLTMEAADVLYGITMEVPGVSKVVGVSFEAIPEFSGIS